MTRSRLAQMVHRRRLELGLTKDDAARAAKVSLSTWHTIENSDGDTAFREITLAGVASALRVDHRTVFELAGVEYPRDVVPATNGNATLPPSDRKLLVEEIKQTSENLDDHLLIVAHRVVKAIGVADPTDPGGSTEKWLNS